MHFEDEIHADLLKTAEDVSKEAGPLSRKLLAPALGLGMALAPGAQAQQPKQPTGQQQQVSSPSYEETAKWLIDKINSGGITETRPGDRYEYETSTQENTSISNGQLRYVGVSYFSDLKKTIRNTNSLRLDAVSATEVKNVGDHGGEAWVVAIHAPTTVRGQLPTGEALNGIYKVTTLWFSDQKTADRVKKALDHLVELSKKPEPF